MVLTINQVGTGKSFTTVYLVSKPSFMPRRDFHRTPSVDLCGTSRKRADRMNRLDKKFCEKSATMKIQNFRPQLSQE
jgi:hypothetical protein